ncbi:MAG: hypothetical protein JW909_11430 [Planctomycetes bacterium]|nr:hypothetical protein [Planctomycetota bacterium]
MSCRESMVPMALAAWLFIAPIAAGAETSNIEKVLDFEGPTFVTPQSPSLPAGWERVVTSRKVEYDVMPDGGESYRHRLKVEGYSHGQYPSYPRVTHVKGEGALKGKGYIRLQLSGANILLRTTEPVKIDRNLSYALGGHYRSDIPVESRIDPRREKSSIKLSLVLLDKEGNELEDRRLFSTAELGDKKGEWKRFEEIPLAEASGTAEYFLVSLELTARDYHGTVDIDNLYVMRRPYMKVSMKNEGGDRNPPTVVIDALGIPAVDAVNVRLTIRDFRGSVVDSMTVERKTSAGRSDAERELHAGILLEGMGYGFFRVDAEVQYGGKVISSGVTFCERKALPAIPTGVRAGKVIDLEQEVLEAPGNAGEGFVVVRVPTSWGRDRERVKAAAEALKPFEGRAYLWIASDEKGKPRDKEEQLQVIAAEAAPYVRTWLIDGEIPRAAVEAALGKAGSQAEVQWVDVNGAVLHVGNRDMETIGTLPATVEMVILSVPATGSLPDVLWLLAELRSRGAEKVALHFTDSSGGQGWARGAAAYWADRIMQSRFEGGSGIAAGVKTMLFSEHGKGLLVYRSVEGAREFSAALGSRFELTIVDLMGNRYRLVHRGRGGMEEALDVTLKAEEYSRAVEGVDLGLLKTSMSVSVDKGKRVASIYRYQDYSVSLVNYGTEPLTVRVAPRGQEGWRFRPMITTPARVIGPGLQETFEFELRPSFLAKPGVNPVGVEIFPESLGRGSFTVWKEIELVSPISVKLDNLPAADGKTAVNVVAWLDKAYPGIIPSLTVGMRHGDGTMRTVIRSLVPGGKARAEFPFILPAGPGDESVQVWMNDQTEGLFYNGEFLVTGSN